jgi:DNA helicase-2/ATP-dependent DNA helicase PcrA
MSAALETHTDSLNEAQQQAVTNEARQLLVIAGAGSGKTRVLVTRILWFLQQQNVSPYRILAVTFTNKAANEMLERIKKGCGDSGARALWVGTFHGIAHRILRQNAQAAGLPDNFQIIDTDDQKRLIKRIIKQLRLDEETFEPKQAIGYISRAKDDGRRVRSMPRMGDMVGQGLLAIYEQYEQYCQKMGLVDFGELLLRVDELWEQNPEVLTEYQNRFTHVLVDEFQDTNAIQYRWLRRLCTQQHYLTAVGDDDQSIYGWRGAKIENIQRFTQDYPKAATVRLEENYRSTAAILEAANGLIAQNQGRLGKNLRAQSQGGEKISIYPAVNEMDEAAFMIDKATLWSKRGGNWSDIAILYRSNAQSRVIEQALRRANIPYRIYGGLRFFDRAEIKDVTAYLRLIAYREDDPAFERVVNMPPRGIGDKTLQNIRDLAQQTQTSLWEAAKAYCPQATGRGAKGLASFIMAIEASDPKNPLPDLVDRVLEQFGILRHWEEQGAERAQTRLENLAELRIATRQFRQDVREEEDIPALQAFLSDVALDAGDKEKGGDEAGVNLMTLHAAKGLEFPLVFIGGLEEGLFPHSRSSLEQDKLEEERRLCYVGITRAMHKLYMTYAQRRAFSASASMNRPSRFITEIPEAQLEYLQLGGLGATSPAPQHKGFARSSGGQRSSKKPASVNSPVELGGDFPFRLGERVRHARFGEGVIVNGEGQGANARLQINFDRAGTKWLVLAYAKLDKV